MKKNKFLNKLLLALSLSLAIIGCDESEEVVTSVDFGTIGSGYYESEGDRTVIIPFRNASSSITKEDLIFDGTATQGQDYTVGTVTQEGVQISLIDDAAAEELETIRITIMGSTENAIHKIALVSDDPGLLDIDLTWEAGIAKADMDMILWKLDENDEWEQIDESWGSTFEHIQIDWTDDDGTYGLTYNYYDGSIDPLNFTAKFTPTGVTLMGTADPLIYNVVYTGVNKDKSGNYQIVQTFKKSGAEFTEFTTVKVPASGSRTSSDVLKLGVRISDFKKG